MPGSLFDGTPDGLTAEIALTTIPNVWQDQTINTVRDSLKISAPKFSQPGRMNLSVWTQSGSLVVNDLAPIRLYQPKASGPHIRYFNGLVLTARISVDGNLNLRYDLDCVDYNWWFQNCPKMPTARFRVGAAPVWVPTHHYVTGDVVQANPSNGHKYTAATGAAGGTSSETQPAFPLGTGATVVEGDAGPPDTRITWTESGSSLVNDITVVNTILDIYFGTTLITRNNINNMIASIPSIEIQPDWTAEQALEEVARHASSTRYFAVYDAWAANTVTVVGAYIEPPSVNGFTYRAIGVTGDAKTGATPPAFPVTIGTVFIDNHVSWIVESRIGRWEPSLAYIAGQRIEPNISGINGYFYDCIVPGTTGPTPPSSWTTTIGNVVINGTTQFMCMGQTSAAPAWQLSMPADNSGHTAPWTPDFSWIDTNKTGSGGVQIITPEYSDQQTQDANHIHYSEITVNREGNGYANRWYVWGRNDSFAIVDDTLAQYTAGGLIISRSHVDTSDTGPSTNSECIARGTDLLALSHIRETVQITAPDPIDPTMIQKLAIGKVTSALIGLGSQQYALTDVSMDFSAGPATWHAEMGDAFLTDRESLLSRRRSGRQYGGDHVPPRLPWFAADWVLANTIDPITYLALLQIQWMSGQEADLYRFDGLIHVEGEQYARRFGPIYYPTQNLTVDLPPDKDVYFDIWAWDTRGNTQRDAHGVLMFTRSPVVHTATLPAPPPAPTITNAVTGVERGGIYYADVTVAHTGDHSGGGAVVYTLGSGISVSIPIPPNSVFPITVRAHNLVVNDTYSFIAWVNDQYGQQSPVSSPYVITVLPLPPSAPWITTPVGGARSGADGYYAVARVNHVVGDHTHGGRVFFYPAGRDADIVRSVRIPEYSDFPYWALLPHLQLGVTYNIWAVVYDQYNQISDPSPTVQYRVTDVTIRHPPPLGFDDQPFDADSLRGLVLDAGVPADVGFSNVVYEGRTSLTITGNDLRTTAVLGPMSSCYPGENITVGNARMSAGGSGSQPWATLGIEWLTTDTTGASDDITDELGGDITDELGMVITDGGVPTPTLSNTNVYSAPASSSWVYTSSRLTAPPLAYGFQWRLASDAAPISVGFTGADYTTYFSYPDILREISNLELAPLNDQTLGGNTAISGTLTLGGGTPIVQILSATASLDFPSIAASVSSELTVAVVGAVVGDSVHTVPNGAPETGLIWSAYVSAADTVTIRVANVTAAAINPAVRTWRATVTRF